MNSSKLYSCKVKENEACTLEEIKGKEIDYIFRFLSGQYEGSQVRLNNLPLCFSIGSSDKCDLVIKDDQIEPVHFYVKRVPDTVYYMIQDLTQTGYWKMLISFDPFIEIGEDQLEIKIMNHRFFIYFDEIKQKHYLNLENCEIKSTILELKDNEVELESTDFELTIGRMECLINLDLKSLENYKLVITRDGGKLFIKDATEEVTNNGFFRKVYNVNSIRAGDIFELGSNVFSCMSINWGVTCDIGDKQNQEDKYVILDDLRVFENVVVPFFSVFDGHNGMCCSLFLSRNFHSNLRVFLKHAELEKSKTFFSDLAEAVQDAILYTDFQFRENEDTFAGSQGSTMVMTLIIGNRIFSANLGDSISMLSKRELKGEKIIYMTKDFSLTRELERKRIEFKKAYVQNDRIIDVIMVSRSFGDWNFKDPKNYPKYKMQIVEDYVISNRAEFRMYEIAKQDDYLVIASDGLYPQINDEKLFELIDKYGQENKINGMSCMPILCENVRLDIINSFYCTTNKKFAADNMTIIVVDVKDR